MQTATNPTPPERLKSIDAKDPTYTILRGPYYNFSTVDPKPYSNDQDPHYTFDFWQGWMYPTAWTNLRESPATSAAFQVAYAQFGTPWVQDSRLTVLEFRFGPLMLRSRVRLKLQNPCQATPEWRTRFNATSPDSLSGQHPSVFSRSRLFRA